jgi:hypothetical protein
MRKQPIPKLTENEFWVEVSKATTLERLIILCLSLETHHRDYFNLQHIFTTMCTVGPDWWRTLGTHEQDKAADVMDDRLRQKVDHLLGKHSIGIDSSVKATAERKLLNIPRFDYLAEEDGIGTLCQQLEEFYWYPIKVEGEKKPISLYKVIDRLMAVWSDFVFLDTFKMKDYLELKGIPVDFGIRDQAAKIFYHQHPLMRRLGDLEHDGRYMGKSGYQSLLSQLGDKILIKLDQQVGDSTFMTTAEIHKNFQAAWKEINFVETKREDIPTFLKQFSFPKKFGIYASVSYLFATHPALEAFEHFQETTSINTLMRAFKDMGQYVRWEEEGKEIDGNDVGRMLSVVVSKKEMIELKNVQREQKVEHTYDADLDEVQMPERYGIRAHVRKLLELPLPKWDE